MSSVLEDQRRILTDVFHATSGPAWSNKAGWNADASLENWFGVSLENDYVVELDLGSNGLEGSIPPELGSLEKLEKLGLSDNKLTGGIPEELGSLQILTLLKLGGNQLSGSIPPQLGKLSNLQELRLDRNNLEGNLPKELGDLTNLTWLTLRDNKLTGNIPPALGDLKNLQVLSLFDNELTGCIPPELGSLENLMVLNLWTNQLSGSIPPELGRLKKLESLSLSHNKLTGSIPRKLGSLEKLAQLGLSHNELTGSIPRELKSLKKLEVLVLSDNKLTGNIPKELGKQAELRHLSLNANNLEGSIPPELGSLENLTVLNLWTNQLSGSIPMELESLKKLEVLILSYNKLTGIIPPELGRLAKLEVLGLSHNKLTGSIPPELGHLEKLEVLGLRNNKLTENIPPELGSLEKLEQLGLSHNKLTGSIPSELGSLENLEQLGLSRNKLTGSIPPQLDQLSHLRELSLKENNLEGSIPPELGGLQNLERLSLNNNQLTGSIPPELGGLQNLEMLQLSYNKLNGSIPPELGGLQNLEKLSLSQNSLTGIIPRELGSLRKLANLNLNNNKLTGFATDTSEDWILKFCPDEGRWIRRFYVRDNPLQYPPVGVLEQGWVMAQKYFQDLRKGRREVMSLKVMLLGPTTVGKTSLMLSIVAGRPTATGKEEKPSTVGVDIKSCDLKGVTLRFFDCGGQQDYHALSNMFLTEGAAYLLVWSPPDDWEGEQLEPFMDMLQHGASESPVLLVANKCDRVREGRGEGDLEAQWAQIHADLQGKLQGGRSLVLDERPFMTSCEKKGGREQQLMALTRALQDLAQTYVVGPILEKAVALLGDLAKEHVFLTMGEVKKTWEEEQQGRAEQPLCDVMLTCAVTMMERDGRLVVAGDVKTGAAVVLTEAALFSKLISPLLTPAGDIVTDGVEVRLGRSKRLGLKPKRQYETQPDGSSALELDRNAANKLKKDGVLTIGFAGSVWNAVLLRHGGDGGRTFDQQHVKALLGRLVDLGIIFEKAEHDNTPGGGEGVNGGGTRAKEQELQFVVSLRMPDAMDSSNERAQALKNAADAISQEMKVGGYLKQVYLQLERPPPPGTIARLVSTLSTKGLGEVAVGWRQGALFVDAQQAYMAFVSYDWTEQRLYLKVAGQWEEEEKQCDSFPTVAMGMLLRHTVHHLSSHKCPWTAVYVAKDPLKEEWGPLREGDLQQFGCVLDPSRKADAHTNERGLLSEYDVERLIATPVLSPRWAPPTLATDCFRGEWKTLCDKFEGEAFVTLRTCVKGFEKYQESLQNARDGLPNVETIEMSDGKGYQVFLSHAGPEKRGIVYLLHRCLWQRGIPTFLDERSLEAGDRAEHKMLHVARTAPIGVVVLSPDFVCREWPLEEMQIFMDRAEKGGAALVPLFFGLTVEECWDTGKLEDNNPGVKETWEEWSKGKGGDWGWLEKDKFKTADELAKDLLGRVDKNTGLRDDRQEDLFAFAKRVANEVEGVLTTIHSKS